MPHGICFLWDKTVLVMTIGGNAIIALSYFALSASLFYSATRRKSIEANVSGLMYVFGMFIFACGCTHVMDIVTLWNPWYNAKAMVLLVTGSISAISAVLAYGEIKRWTTT
jgi:hypothetical protein